MAKHGVVVVVAVVVVVEHLKLKIRNGRTEVTIAHIDNVLFNFISRC